ncbi:MAG: NAD-dependent epimerase/dehydratase family protein [Candidatus Micrarchaeaceae archaeon]
MKFLISGGAGFLGSHIADALINEGNDVVIVDDLSTSKDTSNVPESAVFVEKDISDYDSPEHFDVLMHLAAHPSPEDYTINPVKTLLSNSMGTKTVLDMAKRDNAMLIYTSSSEVYGEASKIPTPEDYWGFVNPNGIRSCYDEGKRFSEALIMAYHREYMLDTRIERPFNVYGPRIRADSVYGRVVPRFISQALGNEDITIHGDGNQTRSFLYVDDWVDATMKMIKTKDIGGSVFNIGSTVEITVNELAERVKDLANSSSKIIHERARDDDPRRRCANIKKARDALGWQPMTKLDDGLLKTIEWFGGGR